VESILGVGTYAFAYQVVQMQTRQKFALKVVEKRMFIKDKKAEGKLKTEIEIHSMCKN
jgi:hypothetical protein